MEQLEMTEPWFSVDEVAQHLGVAQDSIYRWIEGRGLPAHQIGRRWKLGAALPCRLVYIVDRCAVVDQATEGAEELREWVRNERTIAGALGLGDRPLPISTLRGQHVDNREWLDPSAPAIVVGDVRLSFQVAVVGPIMIGRNRYFGGGLFQHSQP